MSGKIRSALLSKGYLPRELPPVFTSFDFGKHSGDIMEHWQSGGLFKTKNVKVSGRANRRGSFKYEIRDTESEIISKPKRTHDRRDLHLVHPIPQLLLANEIDDNWRRIAKWASKSEFSEDRFQISQQHKRALSDIDFDLHRKKKQYIESSSNWILETDITRFYHSIYTHSIPWASYGKERVKGSLKTYSGSLSDRLDALVRSCNRNQTIGIPVGPETSRLIAEIISSRVDSEVAGQLRSIDGAIVDRLQDDWTVGVPTLESAENALTIIKSSYRALGLDINASKTSIVRLSDRSVGDWVAEIRGNLVHRKENLTGANLADFLNMCLLIQQKYPNSPVISYALTITEKLVVKDYDVKAMESFLLRCAVVEPSAMDRVCSAILNLENHSKSVSKERVCGRLLEIAISSAGQGFLYEAIWCLYTIRGLKHRIDARSLIKIEYINRSSVANLIMLDMKHRGSLIGKLPTDVWSSVTKEEIITSPSWLLLYEGIRNGWLSDPKKLSTTAFFKPMLDRNVVFYDKRRNMPTAKAKSKMRGSGLAPSRSSGSGPAAASAMSFVTLADMLSSLDDHNDDY